MSRNLPLRNRLATSCMAASLLSAPLLPVFVSEVRGQVPGPETFAKAPETPLELWEMAEYLVRTGQAPQAAPYLAKFMKSEPGDDVLLQIRDRYGVGSVLRLDTDPATRPYAAPLVAKLAAASHRNATRPERIGRFVDTLTKSAEEQEYAVERLREAGSYAIPYLLQALDRPNRPAEERALIAYNMGRLDRSAVPALIAALDSADALLAVDAANALAMIGDARAVPHLTPLAAADAASPTRDAARRAIARLTGRPFEAQPRSPVKVLVDEARKYHVHAVQFPGDSVLIWEWDPNQKVPVPRQVSRSEAEAFFGQRLAHDALELDPTSVPAQVVLLSQALEKAVERGGFAVTQGNDPTGAFASAVAAGPTVLSQVLHDAIGDRKTDLAAVAATALGQVADRDVLASSGSRVHPLVEALVAPGRRAQFAAARALVLLEPQRPFPGSSQVVPILARFVGNQAAPRAVVIDGNPNRGNQLGSFLKALGYDPQLARTGSDGFKAAVEAADVELIAIDTHMTQGAWRLVDTLSNLRADARTAGIPTYIVGPLSHQAALDSTLRNYPGVKFLVTPTNPEVLEQQLGGRPTAFSDAERLAYAREAASLLSLVAARPGSPFEPDLKRAETALSFALNTPSASLAASAALGDVPDAAAQRDLADVVLDSSKPKPPRLAAAGALARSLQRFGPLVTADHETRLLAAFDRERDPALRSALATLIGALRPKPAQAGSRLRPFNTPPAPAAPGSESTPSPSTSEPAPPAEEAPAPPDAKP